MPLLYHIILTNSHVFCQKSIVIDDDIGVEVDEHGTKSGEWTWYGIAT